MKHLTISSLFAISLLAGCSSTDGIMPDLSPSELYQKAQILLKEGNWSSAIHKLEALDSHYPFGVYSEQVQLYLIYAYYKNNALVLGEATIDRFMRLNPNHPDTSWVLYMRGLTNMAKDKNVLYDLININCADCNPEFARHAFVDFRRLLEQYPNSEYAADAKKRMIALKNRLADYELTIADFYVRRGAWIAVINRCKELQRHFFDTIAAKKSLLLMLNAYEKLSLNVPAFHTRELIQLNNS
ncbi:outer membrane protein assembly factor BamD [Candidatus Enterovibrio altilux]|uniref:Outer membrane protein assembly factor BamD n=1 Tax=Candidatus Enterovibrio altilux TaxID=1927128 RepID=A0A291B6R1_9GAMM|nr:outer membrane protein assembly factor BamD [Candidatus Enterovibrio luxaltus]ATF08699.1 putative component of the lipoprotein assembly complex [Candidatus Enterovibrio luxaltus]